MRTEDDIAEENEYKRSVLGMLVAYAAIVVGLILFFGWITTGHPTF